MHLDRESFHIRKNSAIMNIKNLNKNIPNEEEMSIHSGGMNFFLGTIKYENNSRNNSVKKKSRIVK